MARTQSIAQTKNAQTKNTSRARAKKRERPLGAIVGLAVGTVLATAILIGGVQLAVPHSVVSDFYRLVHFNPTATLPLSPLFQTWAQQIQVEDAVFGTTVPLLCGGLLLGRLAPSYEVPRRVRIVGGLMALGILAVTQVFIWTTANITQGMLNARDGGQQVALTAPASLIVRQVLLSIAQAAVCVGGVWLGQRWHRRAAQLTER